MDIKNKNADGNPEFNFKKSIKTEYPTMRE